MNSRSKSTSVMSKLGEYTPGSASFIRSVAMALEMNLLASSGLNHFMSIEQNMDISSSAILVDASLLYMKARVFFASS